MDINALRSVANGKYNLGEVVVDQNDSIRKINNHKVLTFLNGTKVDQTTAERTRKRILAAVASKGMSQYLIDEIATKLGATIETSGRETTYDFSQTTGGVSRKDLQEIFTLIDTQNTRFITTYADVRSICTKLDAFVNSARTSLSPAGHPAKPFINYAINNIKSEIANIRALAPNTFDDDDMLDFDSYKINAHLDNIADFIKAIQNPDTAKNKVIENITLSITKLITEKIEETTKGRTLALTNEVQDFCDKVVGNLRGNKTQQNDINFLYNSINETLKFVRSFCDNGGDELMGSNGSIVERAFLNIHNYLFQLEKI